ncbi:MAG: ribose 1,5-bisphosphate isomerase, partial [Nanoarchaeota archaeon]|nr:ribose 1,5-bisphosphate isomerase [Nanoarchaeota archaeon]
RSTEPFMRNLINYIIDSSKDMDFKYVVPSLNTSLDKTLKLIAKSERDIVEIGAKKIKKGYVVYTHCHSSTVVNILKKAKDNGVNFEVHNTETRPLYQGRKTAKELSDYGIPVRHYVDSAARLALKKADIMLIGADAITAEGKIINKIGSELISEAANKLNVPVYVCTHSWKFDPKTIFGFEEIIEKRLAKEVWPNKPKNVSIDNFAFEQVNPALVTGIISEIGIYNPQNFRQGIKNHYSWMFN